MTDSQYRVVDGEGYIRDTAAGPMTPVVAYEVVQDYGSAQEYVVVAYKTKTTAAAVAAILQALAEQEV